MKFKPEVIRLACTGNWDSAVAIYDHTKKHFDEAIAELVIVARSDNRTAIRKAYQLYIDSLAELLSTNASLGAALGATDIAKLAEEAGVKIEFGSKADRPVVTERTRTRTEDEDAVELDMSSETNSKTIFH